MERFFTKQIILSLIILFAMMMFIANGVFSNKMVSQVQPKNVDVLPQPPEDLEGPDVPPVIPDIPKVWLINNNYLFIIYTKFFYRYIKK